MQPIPRRPGARARRLLAAALLAPTVPATAQTAAPEAAPATAAAYAPGVDVLHYDLSLTLAAGGDELDAIAALDLRLLEAPPDTLALDLVGLTVRTVRLARPGEAEATADAAFARSADRLLVPLPRWARAGDTLRVVVEYGGRPEDGLILGPNVHGAVTAFADNWPDRARFWFPGIDHPSDKATVSWSVRAPASWEVVANGELAGPPEPAGTERLWRYEMRAPIPTYTMVVGAADFAIERSETCAAGGTTPHRTEPCVEVSSWTFPADSAAGSRAFRRAGEMVAFYSELVAPFPYHKLAHVQSATRYGGMENAGAIFYSQAALARGADIETTVAHETAHQWFGDAVTEADWRHLWLSEGFATYFGALFFEEADGAKRFRELMADAADTYFTSDVTDQPLVDTLRGPLEDLGGLLNANSYQKGAWVLHMLRGLLGDTAFFEGIRAYYGARTHGTALTSDLRRALEEASGVDLGWFFDQWVFAPGHPVLRHELRWDPGERIATLRIEQVQPGSWPAFRLPVTIAFDTPGGEVRRRAELETRVSELSFPLPDAPAGVRLDPDAALLIQLVPRD